MSPLAWICICLDIDGADQLIETERRASRPPRAYGPDDGAGNVEGSGKAHDAPDVPASASNHLLDRGPASKLTRGWVKIVVDINSRSSRSDFARSMFVCFVI